MTDFSNIPIFFILGRERSGTTMLRVSLNNHSRIYLPPESPFILHLYKKYYKRENIKIDKFICDLKTDPYLIVWEIDFCKLKKELVKTKPPTFENYCKTIINWSQKKVELIGDKNPTYSLFATTLNKIYPEAKFIWLIRDYRAQINSMLKVNFEKKIISSLASRWVSYNKEIEKLQHQVPDKVLLVKYENLILSPKKNYSRICSFLNIEFNPKLLNLNPNQKEFYKEHHKSLVENINKKHIEEWRVELTKKQIEICDAIAGKYGAKYGYIKETKSNAFLKLTLIFGVLYGKFYKYFIKLLYVLPLKMRLLINQKMIHQNSTFWKETSEHYQKKG